MKLSIFFLALFVLTTITTSCEKETAPSDKQQEERQNVHITRSSDENTHRPLSLQNSLIRPTTAYNQLLDELGCGYNLIEFPSVAAENITYMVVDIDKLYNENRPRVNIKKNLLATANYTTFANGNSYARTIMNRHVQSSSVGINILEIFGSKVENATNEMFKSHVSNSQRDVFGEIEIGIKMYDLSINMGNPEELSERYATSSFKQDYYNLTPKALVETYGTSLLTNYTTGGKAYAIFKGSTKEDKSEVDRERLMSTGVTYHFKHIIEKSSIGINTDYFNSTNSSDSATVKNNFAHTEVAFRTYGGNPTLGISAFNIPCEYDNLNINLRSWGQSLSDERYRQMITISEKGLYPIYSMIREENIKSMVQRYLNTGVSEPFTDPHIDRFEILDETASGSTISTIYTVLITRHKNPIILHKYSRSMDSIKDSYIAWWTIEHLYSAYPLVTKKESSIGIPIFNHILNTPNYAQSYQMYDLSGFDRGSVKLCKITGDNTDMTYLLINKGNKRYALGIYSEFIKDLYAIDPNIRNMPITNVSNLTGYTVIGL